MKAAVFPCQGAQFVGMGKALFEQSPLAKSYFEKANEILGFRITDVMFEGDAEAEMVILSLDFILIALLLSNTIPLSEV